MSTWSSERVTQSLDFSTIVLPKLSIALWSLSGWWTRTWTSLCLQSDLILEQKYISVVVIYLWDILVPTFVKYERTENDYKSVIRKRLDQINWHLNVTWVYTGKCHRWSLLYKLLDILKLIRKCFLDSRIVLRIVY